MYAHTTLTIIYKLPVYVHDVYIMCVGEAAYYTSTRAPTGHKYED